MSFFLSLSSSFSVSVSPSLSLCLHLSTYLFISLPLPFSLSDSLPLPFSLTSSLSLSHFPSLSLTLSLSGYYCKITSDPCGSPNSVLRCFWCWILHGLHCSSIWHGKSVRVKEWVSVPQTLWFFLSIFYYSRFVSFFYSSLTFLISFCFSSHFILFFIFQVRTRLMNQPSDARIYSGAGDCFMQIVKKDGFKGLYAGKYIRAYSLSLVVSVGWLFVRKCIRTCRVWWW